MNLMEIILGSSDNASSVGGGTCSYFHALCQQSFPGPLVGGNVGNQRKGEVLRLLLALLKIACQHYGKLRSPFGTDNLLKVNYKCLFQCVCVCVYIYINHSVSVTFLLI
jgi:hypothetical protein